MSSIETSLISNSLPLSETMNGNVGKPSAKAQDTASVAQDFESVFVSQMLKEMRKTLEPGVLFGEDSNDVYGGLFDQYLGQHMTESGGLGLSKMVQETLARQQASAAFTMPESPAVMSSMSPISG